MYEGLYGLIGSELSFFSRKLEAQLRFQAIPWEWRFKTLARTEEIEARAGTHFIPVLETPDNWMIHDTIALGPMLNDRFDHVPVIPTMPVQRALCFILEDVLSHWLGRVCIHTRWCYEDNVAWVGPRFGANSVLNRSIDEPFSDQELIDLAPVGESLRDSFGLRVCEATGVGRDQEPAVRGDFEKILGILSRHFAQSAFLLGPRPCLADFALAGACKAHFVCDPTPMSWLGEHEEMLVAYTDRVFGAKGSDGDWRVGDEIPATLEDILDYADATYLSYAPASISAGLRGEKYFEYDYGFGPTRARSARRLNKARLHVRSELRRLGDSNLEQVSRALGRWGLIDFYLAETLD